MQCAFDGRSIRPRRARRTLLTTNQTCVGYHPNRLELVRRPFWQESNPAQVNCREHPASGGHCERLRARLGSVFLSANTSIFMPTPLPKEIGGPKGAKCASPAAFTRLQEF